MNARKSLANLAQYDVVVIGGGPAGLSAALYLGRSPPDAVAREGPARVLIGTHGGATSSLSAPASVNYLAVRLRAGESWRYQPAVNHTVGWVSTSAGRLRVS